MLKAKMLSVGAALLLATGCEGREASTPAASTAAALAPITCTNGPGEMDGRTFETNTTEGVELYTSGADSPVLRNPLAVRTVGAGHVLAADVLLGGSTRLQGALPSSVMWLRVPVCKPGGTADLRGKTVSAKITITGPALPAPTKFWAAALLPRGWGGIVEQSGVPIGSEFTISGPVPSNTGASQLDQIIISVAVGGDAGPAGWNGTITVDDIQVM